MKGLFITFEGGEGAGKSTQIKYLADHLQARGREVLITREPGGTPGAEAVRAMLLAGQAEHLGALAEATLFAAARADHVTLVIKPALEDGKVVLCDRFIDSTRVYQGVEVTENILSLLEKSSIGDTIPELTFILDVPADVGMSRAEERRKKSIEADHFEKDDLEVQKRRRKDFLKIANQEPERCKVLDSTRQIGIVATEIANITDAYIDGQGNDDC